MRDYISVVLSHPVCGHLLQQSQETKAKPAWVTYLFVKQVGRAEMETLVDFRVQRHPHSPPYAAEYVPRKSSARLTAYAASRVNQ